MSGAGSSPTSPVPRFVVPGAPRRAVAVLVAVIDVLCALALLLYAHRPGSGGGSSTLVTDVVSAAVVVSFAVVGGVVAMRVPTNRVGWLLLAVATTGAWLFWLPGGWVPPIGILGIHLLLYFPDGRLPSPRWRWFSYAAAVLIVVLTFTASAADPTLVSGGPNPFYVSWAIALGPTLALLPVFMLTAAVSLRIRFRRSGVVEREQIRWIAWAGAFICLLYAGTLAISLVAESQGAASWGETSTDNIALFLLQLFALLSFALLPVSIGIAVLRFRLFDIDRVVSRTTSYLIVTGLVIAVYGAAVTLTSRALPASSGLAVAAATLAAAAAFRPALGRVQRAVDRRFDRRRYDATRVVDEFGTRLRDVVAPDDVAVDLTGAVSEALQPGTVGLWLRDQAGTARP